MWTLTCYILILAVYSALFTCQLIACHLTHSLIILTDSYVNLYKILDVSLGILHLLTQNQLDKCDKKAAGDREKSASSRLRYKLFGHNCTYNFKRLPILGSFVNGLFLAALLMSAAIEGLQTCIHASHSEGKPSPLFQHPATYPALLAVMALVGLILQYLTAKAHQMRQIELGSESLMDIRSGQWISGVAWRSNQLTGGHAGQEQLDAGALTNEAPDNKLDEPKPRSRVSSSVEKLAAQRVRNSIDLGLRANFDLCSSAKHKSLESVPTECGETTNISLRSFKVDTEQGGQGKAFINSVSADLERQQEDKFRFTATGGGRSWTLVRYLVSPICLITCAIITYYIDNELLSEIADAGLTVVMVVLLFFASYPPMKKAGMILLQTVPEELNLYQLERDIKSLNQSIVGINELQVWALTPRSNRVATCNLLLDKEANLTGQQVAMILREAMFKFSEANIKCSTIEPKFVAPQSEVQ